MPNFLKSFIISIVLTRLFLYSRHCVSPTPSYMLIHCCKFDDVVRAEQSWVNSVKSSGLRMQTCGAPLLCDGAELVVANTD